MLKKLSLDNFKSFKKLKDLEFKPITVLCGVNSCGKSSILQSILLAKQSTKSSTSDRTLLLNGKLVRLGNFKNMIHNQTEENLVLDFTFSIDRFSKERLSGNNLIVFKIIRNMVNRFYFSVLKKNGFEVSLKISLNTEPKMKNSFSSEATIKEIVFQVDLKGEEKISLLKIEFKKMKKGYNIKYYENDNKNGHFYQRENVPLKFNGLFPKERIRFIDSRSKIDSDMDSRIDSDMDMDSRIDYKISKNIFYINEIIDRSFEDFSYIGPLREEPSRRYIYEDESSGIGKKGENAAFIYNVEKEDDILNFYQIKNSFVEEKFIPMDKYKLNECLEVWMEYIGIPEFSLNKNDDIISLNLKSKSNQEINMADVGFGISQVFPILLEGIRIKEGNTLLLEQPEIHLHPNMQMKIADFFIAMAMSKRNLIVETHSEHLINRLVRRILESEGDELSKLINIYFVTPSNEGSNIEKIKIDENNGIINWPNDFFDQAANEHRKIIRAGISKRQKVKGRE